MLFYNMFLGVASILLRIGKSMVVGTLMLSRLDYSVLPRKFEVLDPGKPLSFGRRGVVWCTGDRYVSNPVFNAQSTITVISGRAQARAPG